MRTALRRPSPELVSTARTELSENDPLPAPIRRPRCARSALGRPRSDPPSRSNQAFKLKPSHDSKPAYHTQRIYAQLRMASTTTRTLIRYSPWTISGASTAHEHKLGLAARYAAHQPTHVGRLLGSGRAAAHHDQEDGISASCCPAARPAAPACERGVRRGSPRPWFCAGRGCRGLWPRPRRCARP